VETRQKNKAGRPKSEISGCQEMEGESRRSVWVIILKEVGLNHMERKPMKKKKRRRSKNCMYELRR
jgi:hypothetical protein